MPAGESPPCLMNQDYSWNLLIRGHVKHIGVEDHYLSCKLSPNKDICLRDHAIMIQPTRGEGDRYIKLIGGVGGLQNAGFVIFTYRFSKKVYKILFTKA